MQFNIQLKDSEFSGVCERLLRNHILLESVESTGIKVFQYLGTEAEKTLKPSCSCFSSIFEMCMHMYDCEQWMEGSCWCVAGSSRGGVPLKQVYAKSSTL